MTEKFPRLFLSKKRYAIFESFLFLSTKMGRTTAKVIINKVQNVYCVYCLMPLIIVRCFCKYESWILRSFIFIFFLFFICISIFKTVSVNLCWLLCYLLYARVQFSNEELFRKIDEIYASVARKQKITFRLTFHHRRVF